MNYQDFLASKKVVDMPTGIESIPVLPGVMFPHQRDIVRWALRRGRAAIFAGTGLGKTLMELAWADAVAMHSGKPVILFAPLAVSAQVVREAAKFGIDAKSVADQANVGPGINVTNYQKIDRFDLRQFGGVVLDESSILKNIDGHYRNKLVTECADTPFRLAATATPAPNDFMELGNHAEFLGVMSYTDMLACFFTHDGAETQKWRLKGHAEAPFWRWMCSWAVMLRKPSDLEYDDGAYNLPPLIQHQHVVGVKYQPSIETGLLFPLEAATMQERLRARKDTVCERVARAVEITPSDRPFVWWCNLNAESEALAKAIPGATELRGSETEAAKERKILDFIDGKIRVLVTKPQLAGFGLNFQFCADTGFVGLNDSFEQIYQAIRRFWRFGQAQTVNAHFIAAETEGAVVANIKRKEIDAERMASMMVSHMTDISAAEIRGQARDRAVYNPETKMALPSFLRG